MHGAGRFIVGRMWRVGNLLGCPNGDDAAHVPGPRMYLRPGFGITAYFLALAVKTGSNPYAGLTPLNAHSGPFFSTTKKGGCATFGTIFSLTTSGQEAVLHNFSGKEDGLQPTAGLTRLNGTFYGTTANGGTGCPGSFYHGCGTVYRLSSSNKEEILYRSSKVVQTALFRRACGIAIGGTLYGTTYAGGEKCGMRHVL